MTYRSSNLTNDTHKDVRKDIARLAGVSTGNVTKVKQILDSVTPEVQERLLRSEVSIHRAWQWRTRPREGTARCLVEPSISRGHQQDDRPAAQSAR